MQTVVFSHVVLDDIVEADGHRTFGMLGGAGAYAAVGAALSAGGRTSVGIVSGVGDDFDPTLLSSRGVSADGLHRVDAHTPRTLVHYRVDGERDETSQRGDAHFLAANPWVRHMPVQWRPHSVYAFRDLDEEFWSELDEMRDDLGAHVLWELHAGVCTSDQRAAVLARAGHVDAVSLNLAEARALFDDTAETCAARFLDAGVAQVFVRLGSRGAYATDGTVARYATPLPGAVVDPTGAGNAFSGAAAAQLGATRAVEPALRGAMAAAALTISGYGPPPVDDRTIAEYRHIYDSLPLTSSPTS